jgi:hypothetical protein
VCRHLGRARQHRQDYTNKKSMRVSAAIPRCIPGLLDVHAKVKQVRDDLHMALRLPRIEAAAMAQCEQPQATPRPC